MVSFDPGRAPAVIPLQERPNVDLPHEAVLHLEDHGGVGLERATEVRDRVGVPYKEPAAEPPARRVQADGEIFRGAAGQ